MKLQLSHGVKVQRSETMENVTYVQLPCSLEEPYFKVLQGCTREQGRHKTSKKRKGMRSRTEVECLASERRKITRSKGKKVGKDVVRYEDMKEVNLH